MNTLNKGTKSKLLHKIFWEYALQNIGRFLTFVCFLNNHKIQTNLMHFFYNSIFHLEQQKMNVKLTDRTRARRYVHQRLEEHIYIEVDEHHSNCWVS